MRTFILLLVVLFLSGCTTYVVEKQLADGSYTNVRISSTRSFEQPDLSYTRKGNEAAFDFRAAGADNNTDAFVGMLTPMLSGMMDMMNSMMMKMMSTQPPTQQE